MKKRYIGAGLIILGLALLFAPFLKGEYAEHRQREILKQWEGGLAQTGQSESEAGRGAAQGGGGLEDEGAEPAVGILKIPAIGLEQPILTGATKRNLDISPAAVEPACRPGEEGNFAVAGHNSRTYGRHFNRISELKQGDDIMVVTADGNYSYLVTESFIVEAEDTWVLEPSLNGGEITLITCYYTEEGETRRLIVKGLLQRGIKEGEQG